MKTVQINDLKSRLAYWLAKVGRGESLQITRHNKPCALLSPTLVAGVRMGSRVGQETLTPILKRAVNRKWLALLLEDRDE